MTETIRIDTDARGVTQLTLAMPQKHNALDPRILAELTETAATLGSDDAVRVVVLTGEGPSFCAGGDLGWMRQQMQADRATRMAEARKVATMLQALNEMPKPLIGRVQGNAFGGGIGLMSVCDVVIGVDTAKFGLTETKLGLIPATISPYVLARMGEGRARQVFMSSRVFDAKMARDLGLVSQVVSATDLDATVEAEVKPYLSTAPAAVAAAKALTRRMGLTIDDALIDETVARLADTWETEEAREGVAAFFEKRKPDWVRD